jgi:hypothetical protein
MSIYSDQLKRRARLILDDVREGVNHSLQAVNWALRILGEPA